MKRVWKILKRLLLITGVLILVTVITALLTARQIEGKIKQLFISEINKQLNTEVSVGDVRFTFLENFPYATLIFTKVSAPDAVSNPKIPKGILLKAGSIMLNFNLIDIYRGNYKIKRIDINDGELQLKVYKDLSDNYHLLKPSADQLDNNFSFQLQRINLRRMQINYRNYASDQDYSLYTASTVLRGAFSENRYALRIKGGMKIHHFLSGSLAYIRNKDAQVNFGLDVDQTAGKYRFTKGSLSVGDLEFLAAGDLIYTDRVKKVNATITGKEAELSTILDELPEHIRRPFAEYEPRGILGFSLSIAGPFGGQQLPRVNAVFSLHGASVKNLKSNIRLENLTASGVYTNGSSADPALHSLRVSAFSGTINKSTFSGRFNLNGLRNSVVDVQLEAVLNLSDLAGFLDLKSLSECTGNANLQVGFSGHIKELSNPQISDYLGNQVKGSIRFSQVNLKFTDRPLMLEDVNGTWDFSNNDILVKSTDGKISGSDIRLNGTFGNIIPFLLLPGQHLNVSATLNSGSLALDLLLAAGSTGKKKDYQLEFPKNVDLDLGMNIQKMNFGSFRATNVHSSVVYRNSKFYVNNLNMTAFGGSVQLNGSLDGSRPELPFVRAEVETRGTDIRALFHDLGNFGQNHILDENLSGTAETKIQLQFQMSPALEIKPASLLVTADIKVKNGELINYKTIYGLGKFIRIDDLSRVRFSELNNQFIIKDSKVIIPEMDVKSDALNFTLGGTHTFSNEINYKIRLLLSDVLFRKARAAKKENTEFGIEEEDSRGKTTLYILLTGTVDKPVFKYDSKSVQGKIVANFLNEKQNLKSIFKSEFSKSQKEQDSIRQKEKERIKRQEKGEMIVEWEGVEVDSSMLKKKKAPMETSTRKRNAVKEKKDSEKPALKVEWE